MRLEDEITLSKTLTNSSSSATTIRGDIVTFEEDCLIMICPIENANFKYYRGNKYFSFNTSVGASGYNTIEQLYYYSPYASAGVLAEIGIIPLLCITNSNSLKPYAIIIPVKAGDRIVVEEWVVANSSTTKQLKYKPITLY